MTKGQWKERRQCLVERGMRQFGFPFLLVYFDKKGLSTGRQLIGGMEDGKAFVSFGADEQWWIERPPEKKKPKV